MPGTISPEGESNKSQGPNLRYLAIAMVCLTIVVAARLQSRGPWAKSWAEHKELFDSTGKLVVAGHAVRAPSSRGTGGLLLPHFNQALYRLDSGRAEASVRVLWMGDFHTAADDLPHAVRQGLQERFGFGGTGLVMLGLRQYRHGQVSPRNLGNWKRIPASPGGIEPKSEKLLGLLGMGAIAQSSQSASIVELDSTQSWTQGQLLFQILFRLPSANSGFDVIVGAGAEAQAVTVRSAVSRASGLSSFEVESQGEPRIELRNFRDNPSLFGVIVESRTPGVVVDSLGINEARIATALSWSAEPWLKEVQQRNPALVVLAYGTNEVGDSIAVEKVGQNLSALIGRVRRAAPHSDCLVVGPTDRAQSSWKSEPRVQSIDSVERKTAKALGCAYFSAFEAMGGENSLQAWSEQSPPLASRDRLRLTRAGAQRLGRELFGKLMGSYNRWRRSIPQVE